jgi:hypothetical protein
VKPDEQQAPTERIPFVIGKGCSQAIFVNIGGK